MARRRRGGHLSSLEFVKEIVKRGANVNLRLPKGTRKHAQYFFGDRH